MRAKEFIKDWMVMPYTAKPMGLKKANSHWEPINPSPKRGEGNKVYTKEDEANDRAQHSIWRKNNPIGNNYMNPTDYDSAARGTHIIMDNPTELHFYKVPAENYDQAFDKWLDGKNSDNPRDHEFYDSTKDYASDHQYWGRIEPAQDQMNWPNEPDEDDDDWTDADEKEFGTAQKGEDAMGVGTITKQNTTKDVNGGTLNKMLRNFHLIK